MFWSYPMKFGLLTGNRFSSQDLHRDQSNRCNFVLQVCHRC